MRRSSSGAPVTTTLPDQVSNSAAETERAGMLLGERLRKGDVVLLTGELRDLGLEELAQQGAVVVEWGERLSSSLVGRSGEVGEVDDDFPRTEIKHLGGDRRLIRTIRDLSH